MENLENETNLMNNFFIELHGNIAVETISSTTDAYVNRGFTCHSCKHKASNIWTLLEHVYVAHGFRISDENLPNFIYPNASVLSCPLSIGGPIQTLGTGVQKSVTGTSLMGDDDGMDIVVDVDGLDVETDSKPAFGHTANTILDSLTAAATQEKEVSSSNRLSFPHGSKNKCKKFIIHLLIIF